MRIEIVFKSNLLVTSLGEQIKLLAQASYLHILNSMELIKFNSSSEELKIGESFYLKFQFTQQYFYYDPLSQRLVLSKNQHDRTAFKIVTHEFNWNTRSVVQLTSHQYRIMLTHTNKFVTMHHNDLVVSDEATVANLCTLMPSIYGRDSMSQPLRFTVVESGRTLASVGSKLFGQDDPTISTSMFMVVKDEEGKSALKHVLSDRYVSQIDGEFYLVRENAYQSPYIFLAGAYHPQSTLYSIQLSSKPSLSLCLPAPNKPCSLSPQKLPNIFTVTPIPDEEIKNIIPFAWLHAEQDQPKNLFVIQFILLECDDLLDNLIEKHEEKVVTELLREGFMGELDFVVQKYHDDDCIQLVRKILVKILEIREEFFLEFVKCPKLFLETTMSDWFIATIAHIQFPGNSPKVEELIKLVVAILQSSSEITLGKLFLLGVVNPFVHKYPHISSYISIFLTNVIVNTQRTIKNPFITLQNVFRLKILRQNVTELEYNKKIQPNLTLTNLINQLSSPDSLFDHVLFQAIEMYVSNFWLQKPIKVFLVCEMDEGPLCKTYMQKQFEHHWKDMKFFVDDILPKNCRFENYQNKVISLIVSAYFCTVYEQATIVECKEFIRHLMITITTYSYDQTSHEFVEHFVKAVRMCLEKVMELICENNLRFDSLTETVEGRVEVCEKELMQICGKELVDNPLIWDFLIAPNTQIKDTLNTWLNVLNVLQFFGNKRAKIISLLQAYRVMDEFSEEFCTLVHMFKHHFYITNRSAIIKHFISAYKFFQFEELQIIGLIIGQNQLFRYFSDYENDEQLPVFLTYLARIPTFDALKMLRIIISNNKGKWTHKDYQFKLLEALFKNIGGVVNQEVYDIISQYITKTQQQDYKIQFLKLWESFFKFNPEVLKKKFVHNCLQKILQSNPSEIISLLHKRGQEFIQLFIQLMLNFVQYHSSPEFLYELIGDEELFKILDKFEGSLQLKIVVLKFIGSSKSTINNNEELFLLSQDLNFLKLGTIFIRSQTHIIQKIKEEKQTTLLTQYTYLMIDLLKQREYMINKSSNLPQNDKLTIEGTNKLLSFEIIDLIEKTINPSDVTRDHLNKIIWLENQYKVNVNCVQLANIVEVEEKVQEVEQYTIDYKLQTEKGLKVPVEFLVEKITLRNLVVFLIRILSVLSFRDNLPCEDLELVLSYLNYVFVNYEYQIEQSSVETLFIIMMQFIKHKKLSLISMIQKIIRKSLIHEGRIDRKSQSLLQQLIIEKKQKILDYFHLCLDNYVTFSPIYTAANSIRGLKKQVQSHIYWHISCYISMLTFFNLLSKSLNLNFKLIFSQKEITRKQFIGRIITINQGHLKSLKTQTTELKLQIINHELQLINNLIRGPVEENIITSLQFSFKNIIPSLSIDDQSLNSQNQKITKLIVSMKKLISQAIFILTPYTSFSDQQTLLTQKTLTQYYLHTKKIFGQNRVHKIILSYTKDNKENIQMMFFDLALSLFYCLVKIYERKENNSIRKLQTENLNEKRLAKTYLRRFKMLYQIYRLIVDLFRWILRKLYQCCRKAGDKIDLIENLDFLGDQETHKENLIQTLQYFVNNVANVQIQVGKEIQTVYFLLMKQSKCYNTSIRKDMHRMVGLGQREHRLKKFLSVSDYIIMRLDTEKSIRDWTDKYTVLNLILNNRQLWKSSNFLCAVLLNLTFLFQNYIPNSEIALNIIRGVSYIFCFLLFLIYFIQNLPLRKKVAIQKLQEGKNSKLRHIRSCLQIFNDKTLWFASIYFFVLSLTFIQMGFVALLMFDFFVRFKISKKVTEIVTKPIVQILLIILFSVQIAYLYTLYYYTIASQYACPNTSTCIQITYQSYLGLYKNIDTDTDLLLNFREVVDFNFKFFNIMINNSLLISVLLYEKKVRSQKADDWESQVQKKCFICDGERSQIDRNRNNNKGFFEHIEQQHNLWNYIFYVIYLKNKQPEMHTVIESTILDQWNHKQIDWLPTTFRKM